MKNQGRRLLSWLLAVTMLVSLFPVAALAEDAEATLQDAAFAVESGAAETHVFPGDGYAAEPIGTAWMETTYRIVLAPEQGVEEIHEEPAEDGGEAHEHVHISYPYHDLPASLVVSFDRDVQAGSLGLSTRCDSCYEGGISGWHGFLLEQDLAAGQELELCGSFGSSLSYGKLCDEIGELWVGAFALSEDALGAEMTVTLRLYDETGERIDLVSYRYRFDQVSKLVTVDATDEAAFSAGSIDAVDELQADDEPTAQQWTVALTSRTKEQDKSVCRLSGGGLYEDGATVTVTAYPRKGYAFLGWYSAEDTAFETMLSNRQSYSFTVSEDTSLVALFQVTEGTLFRLTVHGSMYTVNNGAVQTDMATFTYNAGEEMFISFLDNTKEFLYWVNASGNILSTNPAFSFLLAADTEISSYYATNESTDSSAKVIFRNAFKQVVLSRTYYEGQTISFPKDNPNRMGYVFKGWYIADENGEASATEATQESIHAAMNGANAVIVVPGYVPNGEEYTVQVEFTDGTNSLKPGTSVVLAVGDSKTFTAPKIDGKVFHYWTLNGVKASYSSNYTIICAKPGTALLQAVYGDEEPVEEPMLLITQTYTNIVDGKYVISNTLEYYAPADYVVMETGFVYSTNAGIYGVAGGADELVLDAPSTYKHLSGFTTNEGIYTFNARLTNPDRVLFLKGYMICKAPNGEIVTLYTDMKAGSYNGLNNPDGFEIIVVLDPGSILQASASVPQNAKIEDDVIVDNVATLTILVEDTDPADVPVAAEERAKAYDVSINGLSQENDTLILVTLEEAVPAGIDPELLNAYHEGVAMTQVESESALTAADSFYYDRSSGNVKFAVEHFSNYTFVYPRDTYPITYLGVEEATNPNPTSYMAGYALPLQDPTWEGHTFLGWYDGDTKVDSISADRTGPVTLTASWSKNSYTVTFQNEDGTVLQSEEYDYGDLPAYSGDTPVKASTEDYTYTFAGWNPAISAVTGPATYTAVFTEEEREYGDPVWTWDGLSAATATFTAADDESVSKTIEASVSSEDTTLPTCEEEGLRSYTATVTFRGKTYTDNKTETIPALGHDWDAPTYEWAADNSTVTATRVCKNDASHVETETMNTTSAVTKEATCEAKGETTYTATFTNAVFATQTRTVENLDALGHDWNAPTYEWAADNSTVTATRVC
jgi:uncharacterized repeat protein (TIGR02543 family)